MRDPTGHEVQYDPGEPPDSDEPDYETEHAEEVWRGNVPSAEERDEELRRFIKEVADFSNDGWLARKAAELIVLYGDPDAAKRKGLINANVDTFNARPLTDDEVDAALKHFRPLP